jgi:hypothetical protein
VFECKLICKICGSKRKSYKTGKNDMTKFTICIPKTNIICGIRSRTIRRAGHVARMGEKKMNTDSWWGNPNAPKMHEFSLTTIM